MPRRERVEGLIALVEAGRLIEGLENFYHEDCVMQENCDPPRVGLHTSLERQRRNIELGAAIEEIRAAQVLIDGEQVAIEWHAQWSLPDGSSYRVEEVALQRWRGEHIAAERFFYDPRPLGHLAEVH
ncbi:nuclear transport factor 2 family protein [Novosphingobium resinovorum]|uniref:nuclear transport factor 2 family protein n=1 Tax=Novosphingobium resinovorum TaxID=158500 RepID=UPI002ED2C415|nr:nuclear transport factor 2 family protein [Novosphingobium resinovorum]